MLRMIIARSLCRAFWAPQRALAIRCYSTVPTLKRKAEGQKYSQVNGYDGRKYKGSFYADILSGKPELDIHQQKLRQTIHSALQTERIDVHEWPALQDFIIRSIIQDSEGIMASLREMMLDLGYEHQYFAGEGFYATDPLLIQMSSESESSILRILRVMSKVLPVLPQSIPQCLFYRYYQFGAQSSSEHLLDIVGGMESLTNRTRADLLGARLKGKKYRDYWEVYEHIALFVIGVWIEEYKISSI